MAYDEQLERRLDLLLDKRNDFHKQKMFGGVGYLLRGNMCVGIWKNSLILRIGDQQAQVALKKKNVVPFDITGRPMKGCVMVLPAGMKAAGTLKKWTSLAIDFVMQLPRKQDPVI